MTYEERPLCAHCSKPVPKLTHMWWKKIEWEKIKNKEPVVGEKDSEGRTILQITKRTYVDGKLRTARYWTGDYEHHGLFCSKECGYKRAIRIHLDLRGKK